MSIKKFIRKWLFGDAYTNPQSESARPYLGQSVREQSMNAAPTLRVELVEAVNGRVLNVGVYKPNPHGPDWTFKLYVVGNDEPLADAISTMLVMTNGGK
jgi:hypothetical protein